MIGGPDRIDCDGVRFPVHRSWNGRNIRMDGVCDCVKECVTFIMQLIVLCIGWLLITVYVVYLILFGGD
jgi:hypothetical protein